MRMLIHRPQITKDATKDAHKDAIRNVILKLDAIQSCNLITPISEELGKYQNKYSFQKKSIQFCFI